MNPNGVSFNVVYEGMHCVEEGHAFDCPGVLGGEHILDETFNLSAAIKEQRHKGQAVIAPLSMLRCSECGELLDAYGCCVLHGLIDTEAMDGYDD